MGCVTPFREGISKSVSIYTINSCCFCCCILQGNNLPEGEEHECSIIYYGLSGTFVFNGLFLKANGSKIKFFSTLIFILMKVIFLLQKDKRTFRKSKNFGMTGRIITPG